jgi:DNA-binding NarL/FixJ family response regulator
VPDNADSWPANSVGDQTMTRREAEVAGLVSQGLANKVVAKQLGMGEGTVKIDLHSIYQKLHVSNRTRLMLSAIPNRRKKIHRFPL